MMSRPRDQDGGWAWVVMCACAVCVMVTSGMAILAGMFQKVFLEELREDVVITSWVTAIFSSQLQLLGPVSGVMSSVCGCRVTIMVGGALLTAGFLASSFCRDVLSLLMTFGLCSGLGLGLIYSAAIVRVNLSFVKYRPLATGTVMGAGGVGIMVMPPLCSFLLSSSSCWHTLTILASISAQLLVAGALLFPVPVAAECGQKTPRQEERARRNLSNAKTSSEENTLPLLDPHSTKTNICREALVHQGHANTDTNPPPKLPGSGKLHNSCEDIQQNHRLLTNLDAEGVCRNCKEDTTLETDSLLVCRAPNWDSRNTTGLVSSTKDAHMLTSSGMIHVQHENEDDGRDSITGLQRAGQKSFIELQGQGRGTQRGHPKQPDFATGVYLDARSIDLYRVGHKRSEESLNHTQHTQLASSEDQNPTITNFRGASNENSEELLNQCFGVPITCPEEPKSAPISLCGTIDESSKELHSRPRDIHLLSSEDLKSSPIRRQKVSDESSKKLQNQYGEDTHHIRLEEVSSLPITLHGTNSKRSEGLHKHWQSWEDDKNSEEVHNQYLDPHLAGEKEVICTPAGTNMWSSTSTLHGVFLSNAPTSNEPTLRKLVSVLRSPSLLVLCFQLFLANASMGTVLVHFAEFSLRHGTDFDTLALSYSVHGLTLSLARFLLGVLAQDRHVDPLMVYTGMGFVTALINLCTPYLAVTGPLQICAMAGTGIYSGGSYALLSEITIHCTGVDTLSLAFGMEMIFAGLGFLVAPPIAGWLVVITGSYGDAIFLAGCVNLLAVFVAMTVAKLRPVWHPKDTDVSEYVIDSDIIPADDKTTS